MKELPSSEYKKENRKIVHGNVSGRCVAVWMHREEMHDRQNIKAQEHGKAVNENI